MCDSGTIHLMPFSRQQAALISLSLSYRISVIVFAAHLNVSKMQIPGAKWKLLNVAVFSCSASRCWVLAIVLNALFIIKWKPICIKCRQSLCCTFAFARPPISKWTYCGFVRESNKLEWMDCRSIENFVIVTMSFVYYIINSFVNCNKRTGNGFCRTYPTSYSYCIHCTLHCFALL